MCISTPDWKEGILSSLYFLVFFARVSSFKYRSEIDKVELCVYTTCMRIQLKS